MTNSSQHSVGNYASTDVGLKNFMLGTYRYMAAAMAVTATVAYFGGQFLVANQGGLGILRSPFILLAFVIAIPLLFGAVGRKLPSMSLGGVLTFLFGFAAFLGVFMSVITIFYPAEVIAKIFFMTVALFAALSFFGHTTERNLSAYVKYAVAAVIAYIAIMLLGAFVPALQLSGPFEMAVSGIALLAFAFITAWETQMLKRVYYSIQGNAAMESKMSAYGAASLLLVFVNMFQILLSLFGRE